MNKYLALAMKGPEVSDELAELHMKALAVMIAEFEVMKTKLVNLGVVTDDIPTRWVENGQPIVNIDEVVREHFNTNKE